MLKFFLPKLQFHDCDILVTNLQKLVAESTTESGILVANINPFLIGGITKRPAEFVAQLDLRHLQSESAPQTDRHAKL